jgi:hypothetical protein
LEPPNHLLARQVAHNRKSAGNWELYAEHRARITRLSLGLLNATGEGNARVCVLGAGNCNDLELSVLTKHCRELHLIDFDSEALIRGLHTQRLTGGREDVVDVPGGARVTLQGGVDLTGVAFDLCYATQIESPVLIQRALAGPTLDLGGPYDVVVSTTLLTQLISLAVGGLGNEHPNLIDVILAIRDGHLRLLARLLPSRGAALLVTDVVSSDTLPELVVASPDALAGLLDTALASRNFFTGANPYALAAAFRRDSGLYQAVTDVAMVEPWRWQVGSRRYYLVSALSFERI